MGYHEDNYFCIIKCSSGIQYAWSLNGGFTYTVNPMNLLPRFCSRVPSKRAPSFLPLLFFQGNPSAPNSSVAWALAFSHGPTLAPHIEGLGSIRIWGSRLGLRGFKLIKIMGEVPSLELAQKKQVVWLRESKVL